MGTFEHSLGGLTKTPCLNASMKNAPLSGGTIPSILFLPRKNSVSYQVGNCLYHFASLCNRYFFPHHLFKPLVLRPLCPAAVAGCSYFRSTIKVSTPSATVALHVIVSPLFFLSPSCNSLGETYKVCRALRAAQGAARSGCSDVATQQQICAIWAEAGPRAHKTSGTSQKIGQSSQEELSSRGISGKGAAGKGTAGIRD